MGQSRSIRRPRKWSSSHLVILVICAFRVCLRWGITLQLLLASAFPCFPKFRLLEARVIWAVELLREEAGRNEVEKSRPPKGLEKPSDGSGFSSAIAMSNEN
uniref:Putative secreted protein n=1 Tax=Ixodes ricinus TaxID=34613 RepID=A0A6B0UGM4_IXORI